MKRLLAIASFLVLALCVEAGAGVRAAEPGDARARTTADSNAQRQVLVMLRLPPQHFRPDATYAGGYMADGARTSRRRVANQLAAEYGLRVRDNWPMSLIGVDCFLMEEIGDVPLERVLDALAHDARVEWAQALGEYRGLDAGNDPLYPLQPAAQAWHLADLHRISTGRNVTVAVIDSGVDVAHPDLSGQVALYRNFVDDAPDVAEPHGTAIAGIIGARAGNGIGIVGVASGARLLALRACWETGRQPARCNSLTLAKAINFAIENGTHIMNLSLAGPPDRLMQSLVAAAQERGVIVVGAVDPQRPDGGYPASYPGVIAVSRSGERHTQPSSIVYAPGTDVPTCLPGGRWGMVSGSSFSAAHVTGLAALLAELHPREGPQALRRELFFKRAVPVALSASDSSSGQAGSIDACATLARAANACTCQCSPTAATTAKILR